MTGAHDEHEPKDQRARLLSSPKPKPTPTAYRPGEFLWRLHKGFARVVAELRDDGAFGSELQLFRDDVFFYGRRHAARGNALEEAESRRREYLALGWKPSEDGSRGAST
jgi:hypothetical protein